MELKKGYKVRVEGGHGFDPINSKMFNTREEAGAALSEIMEEFNRFYKVDDMSLITTLTLKCSNKKV